MYRIKFELTGRMPLLMHADDIDASDTLSAWRKDSKNKSVSKAGDDRSPPWTWQTYVYSDGEHIAIPAENLMACLRKASAQKVMSGKKTFKESSQSGIFIESEFLDFFVDGKQIKMSELAKIKNKTYDEQRAAVKGLGFDIWAKRASVNKAKHVRARPRFESWSVRGEAEIDAQELTLEVVQEIFELCGRVGIGDWRPGAKTPGRFGMFFAKVELCE